ncbi:MAG: tetratricopeptide repeat protein [Deltaproteobacteria bacterium]|nr:tetratricopeptide repeat protein [Deltaproteobacteria bacterium]
MIEDRQQTVLLQIFLVFFSSIVLFGCAPLVSRTPVQAPEDSFKYQSELAEPNAKALFAFSQFRLLGTENRWEEAILALERAVQFDPETDYLQMILAKAYLHREQPEKSIASLKKLLAKSPDNYEGHELLGDVYSYQQDFSAAVEHFRRALELSPGREPLLMRLAMALARLERKDEAISLLEGLVENHPDAILARLSLARFYLEKGLPEKAMTAYQQLLDREPAQQQAVLEYGKLLEQNNLTQAFELYQSALVQNPLAAAVRQRLAQLYLSRQQLDEALEQFQAVRRQFPGNLQIIGRIALIQLELEHWAAAEADLRLLLDAPQHQDQNRYYLAMALSAQGKTEEAILVLQPIPSASSLYPDAVLQLAYLYNQAGQQAQAIETLQQALADGFHQPDIYYYLTAFLGDQKQDDEALAIAQAAVAKNPSETRLLYQLGVLYEKSGDRQRAVEAMEDILQLDTAHADALNFLAYDQAEQGIALDLALARAQKALELKPSGYIIDTLGWVLFKLGRYAESRERLEEATRLHPEDAVIREHLGDLYRAMKLWPLAAESYRRALQLDPQAKGVREKLESLPLEELK